MTAFGYRRDGLTWVLFVVLLAFGFLNAVLGAALPYIRSVEHGSYLIAAVHQVAFAIGGGLAGLSAARGGLKGRGAVIRLGLLGTALAGLVLGYGNVALSTVPAAFLISVLGTSALVRLWAVLAERHGSRRAVALSEGEVSVSLSLKSPIRWEGELVWPCSAG